VEGVRRQSVARVRRRVCRGGYSIIRRVARLRIPPYDPVAAARFGGIQPVVRRPNQRLDIRDLRMRPTRDTAAHRAADDRSGEGECTSFNRFAHPLGERDRRLRRRAGQDQHEFFAPVAADPIDLSCVIEEQLGKLPEHFVARLMPVRVVDALEFVEVAHHARERLVKPS
jgi:hypothetical protein